MEEQNPIKDMLYTAITKIDEKNIRKTILNGNSSQVINKILALTEKIELDGDAKTNLANLLTSLLHYLLSLAMLPSQRKIIKNGIDIDIILPDLKTLETSPKDAILICIPITQIQRRIKDMEKLQPIKENIWYITEENIDKKTYSVKNKTIQYILDDLTEFLSNKDSMRFRFFKI